MIRQKGQTMRFNDVELGLFKKLFADNEDLLFIIRKVLLQIEVSENEQKILDDNLSDDAHTLIKKHYLAGVDGNTPLNQLADMDRIFAAEMQNKSIEEMKIVFKAGFIQQDYLKQQLETLKDNETKQEIILANLKDRVEDYNDYYINIKAWNDIVSYIDNNLQQMQVLAGTPEESVEETVKRNQQNSSK